MRLALSPVPYLGNPFASLLQWMWPAPVRRTLVVADASRNTYELAKNGILSVFQPLGSIVECLDGCVWITLDGDARDVILQEGESFRPDRNGRALIQALDSSRLRVTQAC